MALFQQDDEDSVIEAALSFVDTFFRDEAGVGTPPAQGARVSPDEEATSEALLLEAKKRELNERKKQLRKAGIYGDPNRARNERTREIVCLREQIEKLQGDLQALQPRRGQSSTGPGQSRALVATPQQLTPWQELARRQRRRREVAEARNLRLKLALERHQKLANSMKNLMQKRASQLTNELMDLDCPKDYSIQALDYRENSQDFVGLFQLLDTAYREVDSVFKANGLADMTIAQNDIHIREGADAKFLEFFSYKELPFGLQATTEATWEHFRGVEKHLGYGNLYEKAAKNLEHPFTIVEDFTKELYSNKSRADIRVKQVLRRHVEPDRDVIVFAYRAVPTQIKHKLLRGLAYHLRGYAVTTKSANSTPERELSVLQLCTLLRLDHDEADSSRDAYCLRALANFLRVHTAQNMRAHRELIENALVDQAAHRISL